MVRILTTRRQLMNPSGAGISSEKVSVVLTYLRAEFPGDEVLHDPQDVQMADRVLTGLEEARGWERGRLKIEVVIQQWEMARYAVELAEASPRVVAIVNAMHGSLSTPELNMTLVQAADRARVALVDGTTRPSDDGRETALGAIRSATMRFQRKWAFNPMQLNAVLNPRLYLSDRDMVRGAIPGDWIRASLSHSPAHPVLWKEGSIPRTPQPGHAQPLPVAELEEYARQEKPLL
jgi:hypothetical protein